MENVLNTNTRFCIPINRGQNGRCVLDKSQASSIVHINAVPKNVTIESLNFIEEFNYQIFDSNFEIYKTEVIKANIYIYIYIINVHIYKYKHLFLTLEYTF